MAESELTIDEAAALYNVPLTVSQIGNEFQVKMYGIPVADRQGRQLFNSQDEANRLAEQSLHPEVRRLMNLE